MNDKKDEKDLCSIRKREKRAKHCERAYMRGAKGGEGEVKTEKLGHHV